MTTQAELIIRTRAVLKYRTIFKDELDILLINAPEIHKQMNNALDKYLRHNQRDAYNYWRIEVSEIWNQFLQDSLS